MAKEEATLLLRIKSAGQRVLGSVKSAFKDIAKGALIAGTAIVGFVGKSVAAYQEQERSINSLNQAMINQGIFSEELSKKYQDQAAALQKVTTFGDEAIIAAQAQLQAYVGAEEVTEDLTKTTLDFATAMGVDLKTAADLVGKTIGSSTNALSRYGIEVDTSGSKSEKMAEVIEKMNRKFGGQAAAQAKGLGSLKQLKNAFGDFMEVVGKSVAPLVTALAQKLTRMAEKLQENKNVVDGLKNAFGLIAKAGAVLKMIFVQLGDVIGGVVGIAAGAITALLEGQFKKAALIIKDGSKNLYADLAKNHETYSSDIKTIDDALEQSKVERDQADLDRTIASSEIRAELKQAEAEQDLERLRAKNEEELLEEQANLDLKNDLVLNAQMKRIDAELINEKDRIKRVQLLRQKEMLMDKQRDITRRKALTDFEKFDEFINSKKVNNTRSTLGTIRGLENSNSKGLVAIGKAAALADITISTAQGVMRAFKLGPILGAILAPLVVTAGVAQAASVAGVQLAGGGIVSASPGGTSAIIGEGGRDEAVIPLDEGLGGMGTNVTIVVNGGMLGTEDEARTFAIAVDEQLFKLRKDNESIAFDSDIK